MLYTLIRPLAALILKLLFQIKVCGIEYIPKEGGFILASNHISYLDPIVLGVASPRRLNFMARHDLFYNPLFARFITALGAFPVHRESADLTALKEAMQRLKNGKALVIFPEGSRQVYPQAANQPQPGIGFLAAKLNIPVIPALIQGTQEALPKGAKFVRPAKISVCFGKQILIERRSPYKEIAQHILDGIRHLSCEISN